MNKFSKWITFGILLIFALISSGCKPEPVVDMDEFILTAERAPTQKSDSNTQQNDVSSVHTIGVEPSQALVSEVYFTDGHGDHGLGILFGNDADVEGQLVQGTSANEVWGSRTGNGFALPAGDGNDIKDSFVRFDLQNHIFYENNVGAEIQIEIEYLDTGLDEFSLEYDALQGGLNDDEFLKTTEFVKKTDSGEFKTVAFLLKDAFMGGRLQSASDFQINDLGDGAETIIKVTVRVYLGDTAVIEPTKDEVSTDPETVEGYAILAEKDDFSDVGFSNMLVDYIDIDILTDALVKLGWKPDHIHALPDYDRDSLQVELDWLEDVADENDVVFMFITGHGTYLTKFMEWQDSFPQEWAQIQSERRVLLVDMCFAARMTEVVNADPNPHLSIAVVDVDEFAWKSLPDEGLSFIGAPFNHYFVEGLLDPEVDTDGNGWVSVQEAAIYGEAGQQDFMHNEVFANPDYIGWWHNNNLYPDQDPGFPHVIVDDTIGEPVYLDLEYYQ